MVVEMVPLKGGIGSIFHPQVRQYNISGSPKWYEFPANWGSNYATDPHRT